MINCVPLDGLSASAMVGMGVANMSQPEHNFERLGSSDLDSNAAPASHAPLALAVAKLLAAQKPGLYRVSDVLGP